MLNVTAPGTATLSQDSDTAGIFTTSATSTVTYTVQANGRMALTRPGSTSQVLYLFNTGAAYGVEAPQASTNPGLVQAVQQTIASSYPAFLTGAFAAGPTAPALSGTFVSGVETFAPATGGVNSGSYTGTFTSTLDSSSVGGTIVSGQAFRGLSNESPTGRTLVTDAVSGSLTSVVYAISANEAVQIPAGGSAPAYITLLTK